jgi:hypothetical protein
MTGEGDQRTVYPQPLVPENRDKLAPSCRPTPKAARGSSQSPCKQSSQAQTHAWGNARCWHGSKHLPLLMQGCLHGPKRSAMHPTAESSRAALGGGTHTRAARTRGRHTHQGCTPGRRALGGGAHTRVARARGRRAHQGCARSGAARTPGLHALKCKWGLRALGGALHTSQGNTLNSCERLGATRIQQLHNIVGSVEAQQSKVWTRRRKVWRAGHNMAGWAGGAQHNGVG